MDMYEAKEDDNNSNHAQKSQVPSKLSVRGSTTVRPIGENQSATQGRSVASSPHALVRRDNSDSSFSLTQAVASNTRVEATLDTAVSTAPSTSRQTEPACEAPIRVNTAVDERDSGERLACPVSATEKSWANIAEEGGQWKQVTYKRRLNDRFIGNKGKAPAIRESNFKAADIKIPFYIYNVDKGASEKDVADYVLNKIQVVITPVKSSMKLQKDYIAYKFMIPRDKLTVFMDENLWPEGVSYRKFINYKYKVQSQSSELIKQK